MEDRYSKVVCFIVLSIALPLQMIHNMIGQVVLRPALTAVHLLTQRINYIRCGCVAIGLGIHTYKGIKRGGLKDPRYCILSNQLTVPTSFYHPLPNAYFKDERRLLSAVLRHAETEELEIPYLFRLYPTSLPC